MAGMEVKVLSLILEKSRFQGSLAAGNGSFGAEQGREMLFLIE
ncbi:hypothetical protein E6C60_1445 [Paenibacillus algicola]|uniref:Uncharacterized protein n=1 Tax=Paenibacillus algicola TaxID=2565926 RepID=A0A4P8XL21_9BACL|nr:hypothetical protein E6C60_1445 [Paenibacillus algicola]